MNNYFWNYFWKCIEELFPQFPLPWGGRDSIFNSSLFFLNQRMQRDRKHKGSQSVTDNITFYVA